MDLWGSMAENRLYAANSFLKISRTIIKSTKALQKRQEYERQVLELREDLVYRVWSMYGIYCYNS